MANTIATLDDIINREDRYDIEKIAFYNMSDDRELVTLDRTLIDIYMPFVRPYITVYRVAKKEREYYRFKPQLLSLDIYGTPSLAWLIMQLNDKECPSKFYIKSTINLIPANTIEDLYTEVCTRSKKQINTNWNKYLRMVGEDTSVVPF